VQQGAVRRLTANKDRRSEAREERDPVQLQITPTDEGFRLDGELDMATAEELSKLLRTASSDDSPIVLDFSGISFMDSSGLSVLLEAAGQNDGHGSVVILNPSAQVRRVLEISIPGGTPGLEVRG
jgi:anti-anti-sigma factor